MAISVTYPTKNKRKDNVLCIVINQSAIQGATTNIYYNIKQHKLKRINFVYEFASISSHRFVIIMR